MDYFLLSQDNTIPNAVEPVGILKTLDRDMINKENAHIMDGLAVQFEVKESSSVEYVDFIESPVPLVSDKLKEILSKYDKKVIFKPIFLADIKRSRQEVYWLMVPEDVECLSPKSEFNKNGTIKSIVIDEERVKYCRVFKIKGVLENLIVIRLDVAESILRRGFSGIRLTRLEKEILKEGV